VAWLLASGRRDIEVSRITGYSPARIATLRRDPLFQDLLEFYSSSSDAARREFTEMSEDIARDLAQSIHEDILDGTPVPLRDKAEAYKIFADRAGFAPIQRTIRKNLNVTVAERMERARRSRGEAGRLVPNQDSEGRDDAA
jgi:hypothetical protein